MAHSEQTCCRHFGQCGGCQWQDVPYEKQLQRKEAVLQELLAEHWNGPIPVIPSPIRWNYRNKVDPNFAPKRYETPPPEGFRRETVLGFKKTGRWYWPLDIAECRIGPEGLAPLLESVRQWYQDRDLDAFDSRRQQGFLRTLLVRDGKRSGEKMVVLITSAGELDRAAFVECVLRVYSADSIWWGRTARGSNVTLAEDMELLYGKETIDEELHVPAEDGDGILHFRISPFSFTQTNTLATERLYGAIRDWIRQAPPKVLYDLYGGAGGIAFSCADLVDRVFSVENVESATLDGRYNAETNAIDNVEFYTEKVKNFLVNIRNRGGLPEKDCVFVLDPPRSGLHPKVLKRIGELLPREVVYVSCKPSVFAGELPTLLEHYRLADLKAVDLFPHTHHVELLARLVGHGVLQAP